MQPDEYVRFIREDGDSLADAAEGAMGSPVAWCPGWTGRDVVAHTGRVHRLIADRVRRGSRGEDDVERPDVPRGDDVLPWYREGLDQLVDVLLRSVLRAEREHQCEDEQADGVSDDVVSQQRGGNDARPGSVAQ